MITERRSTWRILSIIVAFMLVFTTVMLSAATVEAKVVKPTKITLKATAKANKKVKKAITITVKKMTPTKVVLNKKSATLVIGGDTLKLEASLKPVGVYNKGVT